jgi:hypothetical protein
MKTAIAQPSGSRRLARPRDSTPGALAVQPAWPNAPRLTDRAAFIRSTMSYQEFATRDNAAYGASRRNPENTFAHWSALSPSESVREPCCSPDVLTGCFRVPDFSNNGSDLDFCSQPARSEGFEPPTF